MPGDAALLVRLVREAVSPDILFLEGFKHSGLDKVAVGDIAGLPGTVLRVHPKDRRSVAALARSLDRRLGVQRVADRLPGIDCGKCGLDCGRFATAVAAGKRRLSQCANLSDHRIRVRVDGEELRLGRFPREMVASALLGLVAPLKLPGRAGADAPARRRIRRVEISLER